MTSYKEIKDEIESMLYLKVAYTVSWSYSVPLHVAKTNQKINRIIISL